MTSVSYNLADSMYYASCDFADRMVVKEAGFTWDPLKLVWNTGDPIVAGRLARFVDEPSKPVLERHLASLKDSATTGSDLSYPIPKPPGEDDYLPFQRAGVKWAVERKICLIADEPGLGKTIQGIGAAVKLGIKNILVVCPAVVKINWQREIDKWHVGSPKIQILYGYRPPKDLWGDVVIVNYDLLTGEESALVKMLCARRWKLGIFDECHVLRNMQAQRTAAVLSKKHGGIAHSCERIILLSGTPILNRPAEFYPILRTLSPRTINPHRLLEHYETYFCAGHYGEKGWNASGSSNAEELNRRLRSTIMMRRMKNDVLKDLPPKTYQMLSIEPDAKAGILVKEENEIVDMQGWRTNMQKMSLNLPNPDEDTYGQALGKLARIRKELAIWKVPIVVKHVEDMLENGVEKILVFAYHRDVVETLEKKFAKYNPMKIIGGMTAIAKQTQVDAFQQDPSVRVGVCNILAAGVGITLTAASNVVFAETTWSPGEIDQAVDRCHRKGQKENVLAQFIVVRGSIDEHIMRTIVDKKFVISKTIDKENYHGEENSRGGPQFEPHKQRDYYLS